MEEKIRIPLRCKYFGHDADHIDTANKTAVCRRCGTELVVRFDNFSGEVVPVWGAKG